MASTKIVSREQTLKKAKKSHNLRNQTGTVAIVGMGYVGLPLALLAAKKGYKTIGIEINSEKVEQINRKIAPYSDPITAKLLKHSLLEATSDFAAIREAATIAVCVPTPVYENHLPNLEPVKMACLQIGKELQPGQLVILESTVNPGVSESVVIPLLEQQSGLKCGVDFYLAHCPERINPGDDRWTVENIPRVVGSLEETGLNRALAFYQSVIDAPIKPMKSLKEAESVKIVENAFRDINLAFVNEIAMSFSKLGIDVLNVIEGASTKPFAFLPHFPGCGVGGHCIPVDPYYLIDYAKKNGFSHNFLSLARRINNYMPKFTVDQLEAALQEKNVSINGARVAVLGLAYKPNIDDCRESPAFKIVSLLQEKGVQVTTYDPYVLAKSQVQSLEKALTGAQAIVIATAHTEFVEKVTADLLAEKKIVVVVDGRNCLNKEAITGQGLIYKGIGR